MVKAVGSDIIEIERVAAVWERHPWRFGRRVFTPAELVYCQQRSRMMESLAARWAAKEAAMKSLGLPMGSCRWTDLEVVTMPGGQPTLHLKGKAALRARQLGITTLHLSLSHCDLYAQAVVVAE